MIYLKSDIKNASPNIYAHKKHLLEKELQGFLQHRPNLTISIMPEIETMTDAELLNELQSVQQSMNCGISQWDLRFEEALISEARNRNLLV